MANKKTSSTKQKKTNKATFTNSRYFRVGLIALIIAILFGILFAYSALTPKEEKNTSASALIDNLASIAETGSPTTQTGYAIKRTDENSTLSSDKEKTVVWMASIPESSYESSKSKIDSYFIERSYTKHANGTSGAGVSVNYDGKNFSCQVDDWGASTNGTTGVNENTLLVACASTKDFKETE